MKFVLTDAGWSEWPNPVDMVDNWAVKQADSVKDWAVDQLVLLAKYIIENAGPICMVAALACCLLRIMGMKRAGKWCWWSIMAYLILLFIKEATGL